MSWSYNIDLDSAKVKALLRKMRHAKEGVPTRDRPWGLRTFSQCFVGREAVEWIAREQNVSTDFAVTIGNSLLHKGVIEHVTRDHEFKNELLFYRFRIKKKVVIVGGGFAGAKTAKALEKDYNVTLIDKKDHFACTLSYQTLVVNDSNYSNVTSPHRHYLKQRDSRIVVGEVHSVDPALQLVKLLDGTQIEYDYLILATGSKYDLPFPCDPSIVVNVTNLPQLRAAQERLRMASNIVIVGGGPVSLEVAGEIAHHYGRNSNRGDKNDNTVWNKQVTMISSSKTLMERATNIQAHKSSLAFLLSNGVSVLFGEKAIRFDEERRELVTDRDTRLPADLIYLCIGFKPNTEFLRQPTGEITPITTTATTTTSTSTTNSSSSDDDGASNDLREAANSAFSGSAGSSATTTTCTSIWDCLDNRGYVVVNSYFQVKGFDNIFAMGDIASVNEEKLAQCAESHSEYVVSNIHALDSGFPMKKYEPSTRMLIVSLGPQKALVINGENVYLDGRIASYIKSFVQYKVMRHYR